MIYKIGSTKFPRFCSTRVPSIGNATRYALSQGRDNSVLGLKITFLLIASYIAPQMIKVPGKPPWCLGMKVTKIQDALLGNATQTFATTVKAI